MRLRRFAPPLLLVLLGCVNDYHPEYHPQTSYRYVQNISYPQTLVYEVAPASSAAGVASKHSEPRTSAVSRSAEPRVATESVAIADRAPPSPITEKPPTSRPVTSVAVFDGEDTLWQDLFLRERDALRRQNASRSSDDWEAVVGRPPTAGALTDVVVDVTLDEAKAIARRTPLINVHCLLPGFHAVRYGVVSEIKRHPGKDAMAQVLLKVDAAWDNPWKQADGKPVGVRFDVGEQGILAVGHVAGAAAETGNEALVRKGPCRRDGTSLSCNGSPLRIEPSDGVAD
jgi:hypothetical protein